MEFQWAVSNPQRWCCQSAALNMTANLENSTMATGLENICFHFNPKGKQCQRMLKLPHSCTHLTLYQSDAQNSPRQASMVHEPWTSRYSSWIWKRQRNQRSNCLHLLNHWKSKRVPEKHLLLLYWLFQAFDCVDHHKLWKILQEMGILDHLTSLLRNL